MKATICTMWDLRELLSWYLCFQYVVAIAFFASLCLFLTQFSGVSVCLSWNCSHELKVYSWVWKSVLSLLAHQCRLFLFGVKPHTANTFEKTPSLSSGGKDNEFLCWVKEGASPCFRKYNRQNWHGVGDRGQSSLKGQICWREWTYCKKKTNKKTPAAAWEFCIHLHWGGWTDSLIRGHFASKLYSSLSLLLFAWQQLPL